MHWDEGDRSSELMRPSIEKSFSNREAVVNEILLVIHKVLNWAWKTYINKKSLNSVSFSGWFVGSLIDVRL